MIEIPKCDVRDMLVTRDGTLQVERHHVGSNLAYSISNLDRGISLFLFLSDVLLPTKSY